MKIYSFNYSSVRWVFRVGVECKWAWVFVNEVRYKAYRWLRSVAPDPLFNPETKSVDDPIIFELTNNQGDTAKGEVTSHDQFVKIATGQQHLELDGWL